MPSLRVESGRGVARFMEQVCTLVRHRITRRSDFQACYTVGRRLYSAWFILFVRIRDDKSDVWRVGFAVSKKVGNAVVRNRVKRVLREFFRLYGQALPAHTDIVVVPKKQLNTAALSLNTARLELEPLLGKCTKVVRR